MRLRLGLAGVEAGALQNHVHAQLAPGQLGGVGLGIDGNGLTVDNDVVLAGFHGVLVAVVALGGIVLQQVSQHLGRGQVIDGDNLITLSAEHLAESQTADPAEAVDCNFNRHGNFLHSKLLHCSMIYSCRMESIIPYR